MRAVFLHILADTLGSATVILSSALIDWLGPKADLVDAVASLIVSLLILAAALPLLLETVVVLAQGVGGGAARYEQWKEVRREVEAVDGVCRVEEERLWELATGHLVGTLKVTMRSMISRSDDRDLTFLSDMAPEGKEEEGVFSTEIDDDDDSIVSSPHLHHRRVVGRQRNGGGGRGGEELEQQRVRREIHAVAKRRLPALGDLTVEIVVIT